MGGYVDVSFADLAACLPFIRAGKVKALETVVEGFERLPDALNMLFDGANTGKLSVKIG